MKTLITLLISSALVSLVYSCKDGKSNIITTLQNIQNELPNLISQVQNMPECQTSALKPVCSKGYQYWNSKTDVRFFKGVYRNMENLEGFYDVLLQYSALSSSKDEKDRLKAKFALSAFTNYMVGISLDLTYSKTAGGGKGAYIAQFIDQNCENSQEIDFLYAGVTNDFKLACDVFVLEEKSGGLFHSSSSQKLINENANLSYAQYEALIKLMEISVFANAKELVASFQDA